LRRLPAEGRFATLVRLLVLNLPTATAEAEAALAPLALGRLEHAGILVVDEGTVRSAIKLVPHGDLLIASDPDREGDHDWVAGINPPSVTLAKLTVRRPAKRALDVGTGNGVQALLAARHSDAVVATDVNSRALEFAGFNARLNGVENLELRQGSFFEPVAGERFDLIVSNPPFVISPESAYAYRDSGLPGDQVSRDVVRAAAEHLEEGGFAHVLISWAHAAEQDWREPVASWVEGLGCDVWLLHFGSDDPVTHASGWLRPVAAAAPELYEGSLDRWLDYLRTSGVGAVAYGGVVLRKRAGERTWLRADSVSLEREGAGLHVERVFDAQDLLERLPDDRALLDQRLALVADHELEQALAVSEGRLEVRHVVLSLTRGLAFEVGLDEHTLRLLPLLDGKRTLREVLDEPYATAALPAVRRLLELGFLDVNPQEPVSK
jgi:methylase of polypeptide subunit release factors